VASVPSVGRASEVEAPVSAETAATDELYKRHAERIYRFCLRRLRSREEADDATQTTFLNAFRGLRRGVMPELELAWLFKIAENVCLARLRSNVRRLRVESPVDLEPLKISSLRRNDGATSSMGSGRRSHGCPNSSAGRSCCASGRDFRTSRSPPSSAFRTPRSRR
jgi:hypothetical protein